jgi:HSP20 family protein
MSSTQKQDRMETRQLTKCRDRTPFVFDDFFKHWNACFDNRDLLGRTTNIPAVNITEQKDEMHLWLAAPGFTKGDFKIDVEANMLTITGGHEQNKGAKEKAVSRKDYCYSFFRRSFPLPEEIIKEKIDAKYERGVLSISLPRKEDTKKRTAK